MGKIGVFCDIEYDIILVFMISWMISWILHDIMVAQGMGKTWYHIWHHSFYIDIIYDIVLVGMISCNWKWYHTCYEWYHKWYQLWYHVWYHMIVWYHITVATVAPPLIVAPPSFRVSSAATVTPRFSTASRTISVLEAPPPTRRGIGATAAGSMWRYGRGRPRMVSIAKAERIRRERISESRTRAAETRKRCSEAAAAVGAAKGGGSAHWSNGHDIISDIKCNIITYVYMISYAKNMMSLSKLLMRGIWCAGARVGLPESQPDPLPAHDRIVWFNIYSHPFQLVSHSG